MVHTGKLLNESSFQSIILRKYRIELFCFLLQVTHSD